MRSRFLLIAVCLAFPAFVLSGAPPPSPLPRPLPKPSIVDIIAPAPIPVRDLELERLNRATAALLKQAEGVVKVEESAAKGEAGPGSDKAPEKDYPILITLESVKKQVYIHAVALGDLQFGRPDFHEMGRRAIHGSLKEYERALERAAAHPSIIALPPAGTKQQLTPAERARADLNGDGKLSPDELEKFRLQAQAAAALRLPESGTSAANR